MNTQIKCAHLFLGCSSSLVWALAVVWALARLDLNICLNSCYKCRHRDESAPQRLGLQQVLQLFSLRWVDARVLCWSFLLFHRPRG